MTINSGSGLAMNTLPATGMEDSIDRVFDNLYKIREQAQREVRDKREEPDPGDPEPDPGGSGTQTTTSTQPKTTVPATVQQNLLSGISTKPALAGAAAVSLFLGGYYLYKRNKE